MRTWEQWAERASSSDPFYDDTFGALSTSKRCRAYGYEASFTEEGGQLSCNSAEEHGGVRDRHAEAYGIQERLWPVCGGWGRLLPCSWSVMFRQRRLSCCQYTSEGSKK
ncbi:uncharacterized protein LOC142591290 [Dermacentor variabilis]|uniref:uncharacterized protein LOC142591290 n=1 Tax=Dermacentor variabilis TaxID=34621 RepID=UPI003F5C6902